MKILISILTIGIIFSCSSTKKVSKNNEITFKTITQASYSSKRNGELARKEALKQNIERKEIYDKQGVLVEYCRYEVDGTIYQKTELTKNKDGKLIKSITFDKEGDLKSYTTTEFDFNGNIIVFKTYDSNDELTSIQKNEYDSKGNQVLMTNTRIKSNKTFKTTSEYNSKNQLIKETDFRHDGTIKDVRTFVYDEKGNEIESELRRSNGDYTKFISEYDELGNLTVLNWYDEDGKQKYQNSFTYVYDKNNNWITKKRFSNGELGYVWEREIEYY